MSLEDKAQEHEAMVWSMVNRPREVVTYGPGDRDYGPEECCDCGDDMHQVRRSYGFTRCTPCASLREGKAGRR